MANCNCEFPDIPVEEDTIENRLKGKLIDGKELIYFSKKIQDEIAGASSSSPEVLEAVASAKGEILEEVYQLQEEAVATNSAEHDEIQDKLDLILSRLDDIEEKLISFTPYPIQIDDDSHIGYIGVSNLLDPDNEYFGEPIYGEAVYVENVEDVICALREGRSVEFSRGESGISVLTDTIAHSEQQNNISYASGNRGFGAYEIPQGLEVFEYFRNGDNDFFVFRNAVVNSYGDLIPSSFIDKIEEGWAMANSFYTGQMSFDDYMEYFGPYATTVILCRSDGGVKSVPSSIIIIGIPKEDFEEVPREPVN